MPNPYFKFKQFTVYHDLCAMKVGIDGVLLGVWSQTDDAKQILDIGTGSGLIALMLAQRSDKAQITAIDIDQSAVTQTEININNSPWKNRIRVEKVALQDFEKTADLKFDLIVSNPPYFVNSLKAPDEKRNTARHTDTLTHEELILNSLLLLSTSGRICLILPVNEGEECIDFAEKNGLYCTQKVTVYPKPNTQPKRLLIELSREYKPQEISDLTIEADVRHQYSPEFTELAKDFYLKL